MMKKSTVSKVYFPSKQDLWLKLIVWIPLIAHLVYAIWEDILVAQLIVLTSILLMGWLWIRTGYTITERELLVRCGPIHNKIPLDKIIKVRRSNSFWSAPALSLDRLEIKYQPGGNSSIWDSGEILISPADRECFLKKLQECCPGADIRDEF